MCCDYRYGGRVGTKGVVKGFKKLLFSLIQYDIPLLGAAHFISQDQGPHLNSTAVGWLFQVHSQVLQHHTRHARH